MSDTATIIFVSVYSISVIGWFASACYVIYFLGKINSIKQAKAQTPASNQPPHLDSLVPYSDRPSTPTP